MTKHERWTIAKRGPRPVDVHVGRRARLRRTILGMSQEKLGKELGLTFQQVQKNERGTNRIGASRLYQLSDILDVPVSYFFDGLDQPAQTAQDDPLARRETLELVRAYYRIKSGKVRKRIFELTKTIAKAGDTE